MGILGWALVVGGALALAAGMLGLLASRLGYLWLPSPKHPLACLVGGTGGLVVGAVLLSASIPASVQDLASVAAPLAATDSMPPDVDGVPAANSEARVIDGVSFVTAGGITMEAPRVLSSDFYPCTECHAGDRGTDYLDREVDFHVEKVISGHGEPVKWCFDCHNPDSPNTLRLVGGEAVGFDQAHVLCGQCHGKIHAAWAAGAYGKRVGFWDGEKRLFSCAECHDPHQPRFEAIRPDPAPMRPAETLR